MYKVLLVDDDKNMLTLLQKEIPWEQYGCEIIGAVTNGEEALCLMNKLVPNMIISDVRMPVMNGMDFCKRVRQSRDDISIILLSAYESIDTARLAIKYNVTDYLLKPLNQQNMQLLCQIIQESVNDYTQQCFFSDICNKSSRQREIAERLELGDRDWLLEFFSTYKNCCAARFQLIQSAGYVMIKLLYAKHPNAKHLIEKSNEMLRNCISKLEMNFYVAQLYNEEMHGNSKSVDYQYSIYEQILDYVSHNFMLPDCGSSMLAERFHFSADHISRLFKKYSNETLNVYINKKRMEYALELLHKPELSINEVAIRSGFYDQNYFSRVFRKHLQVSPSEYRMELRIRKQKLE